MGCYTIYFIIAVSLTTVNLDLLTELEHFDNIIEDGNDTAIPPKKMSKQGLDLNHTNHIIHIGQMR